MGYQLASSNIFYCASESEKGNDLGASLGNMFPQDCVFSPEHRIPQTESYVLLKAIIHFMIREYAYY